MSRIASLLVAATLAACAAPRVVPVHDAARPVPRLGQDPPPAEVTNTVAFTFDNDFFTSSDNNYTNGIGLSCLSGPVGSAPPDSFVRSWTNFWSFLPFIDDASRDTLVSWTLGQEMFTPDVINVSNPPLDDQPYAGVLFLDFGFYGKSKGACHVWNLRTGLVGPNSGADDLQTAIHELIDDEEPRGWNTQLPNEPILNLDYSYAFQLLGSDPDDTIAWRIVPEGTAGVGTYFTGAAAALYGEVGWNLGDTVGIISLRQGLDPISLVATTRKDTPSITLHAGGGGFAVGHYLPLDGTVFRDSRSVDSEPFVGFFSWGASFRFGRFSANYLLSFFTDTFETQRRDYEFGTVSLAWSL